jgi:hypothetical protein
MVALADCGLSLRGGSMARNLREVIAALSKLYNIQALRRNRNWTTFFRRSLITSTTRLRSERQSIIVSQQ